MIAALPVIHQQTSQGGIRCSSCLKPMFKVTAKTDEPIRGVIWIRCPHGRCGHYQPVDLELVVIEG